MEVKQQQQPSDGAGSGSYASASQSPNSPNPKLVEGLPQEHQEREQQQLLQQEEPHGHGRSNSDDTCAYNSSSRFNSNKYLKTLITVEGNKTLAESCFICGRTFSSKKALCGHMRSHSDKERRERRRCTITSDSDSDLTLSFKRKREPPETADQEKGPMKSPGEEDILSMFRPWSAEKKAEFLEQVQRNATSSLSVSGEKKTNNVDDENITASVTQMRTAEVEVGESATDEELKFKCSQCNKAFRTHQALGGHKSSHYKFAKQGSHYGPEKDRAVVEEKQDRAVVPKLTQTVGGRHQCEICGKTYAKGQSLGGHKRLHWIKPIVKTPTSAMTSQQNDCSQTACKKVFDINLNEGSPIMEEQPRMSLLPLFV